MKFKNLNVNWNKLSALVLAGVVVIGFAGCGKNVQNEDIQNPNEEIQTSNVDIETQYISYFLLYDEEKDRTFQVKYENLNNFLKENVAVIPDYESSTGSVGLQLTDSNGMEKVIIVGLEELQQYVKGNIKFKGMYVPLISNENNQKKKSLN